MVELWTDNSFPSATVGSNLHQVWCIDHSVEETVCYNSNCRTPGLRVNIGALGSQLEVCPQGDYQSSDI